jgi:sulfite reductase alpha subunit-like flavoprotein
MTSSATTTQPTKKQELVMRHTIVTYTVKPGREDENAALVRAVFEELAQTNPDGLRYAVFHLPDSRQFIHLYTDEGSPSGVQALDSFKAFVAARKSATSSRPPPPSPN